MAASTLKLFSWGANGHGQLCAGHGRDESIPVEVPEKYLEDDGNHRLQLSKVRQICGGGSHVIFLTGDGKLYSCGQNNKGQLGIDTHGIETRTLKPIDDTQIHELRFCKVACGWEHTLCLTNNGRLWGWGANNYGQLGIPQVKNTCKPSEIMVGHAISSENILDIAAGPRHSLVVTVTGDVYVWGCGRRGQLGVALNGSDKTLEKRIPTKVTINERIVSVACGMHHSLALTDEGDIYVWGCNGHGLMAINPIVVKQIQSPTKITFPQVTKIKRVVSGWSHAVAVSDSSEIFTWGRNDYGQLGRPDSPYVPKALTSLDLLLDSESTAIYSGAEHNLAINRDLKCVSWGWNEHGICGVEGPNLLKPQIIQGLKLYSAILVGTGYGSSFAIVR